MTIDRKAQQTHSTTSSDLAEPFSFSSEDVASMSHNVIDLTGPPAPLALPPASTRLVALPPAARLALPASGSGALRAPRSPSRSLPMAA